MIEIFRKLLWRILGINYYIYLKGKNTTYLKDAKWAVIGDKTYDNGAFVWKWYNNSGLVIGKYCSIATMLILFVIQGIIQKATLLLFLYSMKF